MSVSEVRPDMLWVKAGECFIYLLWGETVMRDFVVLREGGEDMRRRYSVAYGKDLHPSDFTHARLELGIYDFGVVKNRLLGHWPKLTCETEVQDAIERVVLWRNALGHANVQPFRAHLLYTPTKAALDKILTVMKCPDCLVYLADCECPAEEIVDPISLTINDELIRTIYRDIRLVDLRCFRDVASALDVEYRGIAWPLIGGGYEVVEYHRSTV